MLKNKFTIAIALTLILSGLSLDASAESTTSTLACAQPSSKPNEVGTLVLAGQNQQLTSTEWGIQQGCFKKYGLTIKTTSISSATVGLAGVISGSYDMTTTTPTNLIQAKLNGNFPGKIIAPRHGYSAAELDRAKIEPFYPGELLLQTALIVRSDSKIKNWKDLDKKKVGVQTIQSADQTGLLLAMRGQGVRNPKTEFIAMPGAQMSDALKRGDVDAVIAPDPYASQLVSSGNIINGYPQAYFAEPGPAVVFLSSVETTRSKARELRIFQKATLEINRLLNKKENEDSFRKVIAEVTKVSPEIAAKTRLPIMMENYTTIPELAYIPSKLKKVGFLKGRFELGPILFR